MSEVENRLLKCFSAVFPELTPEEIVNSRTEGGADSDSLSAVTLLAVVEEEFGISVDVERLDGSVSFESLLAQVSEAIRQSDHRPPAT